MKQKLLFALLLIVGLSSCKIGQIIEAVDAIENKEVKTTNIHTFDGKHIKLVPMTHFGQKEFYDSLKDSINLWKNNGYRMYYEEMSKQAAIDMFGEEKAEITVKKWRRIHGGNLGNRDSFEEIKNNFEGAILQPEWVDMKIDDSDLNADINLTEFMNEYERRFGEVKLTQCDHDTPIDAEYKCSKEYDNNMQGIIINYRNQRVVDLIDSENDSKIVILYGKRHMKDLKKRINKRQ